MRRSSRTEGRHSQPQKEQKQREGKGADDESSGPGAGRGANHQSELTLPPPYTRNRSDRPQRPMTGQRREPLSLRSLPRLSLFENEVNPNSLALSLSATTKTSLIRIVYLLLVLVHFFYPPLPQSFLIIIISINPFVVFFQLIELRADADDDDMLEPEPRGDINIER